MNCAEWEGMVSLYADGDLAAAEALDVERHLAVCAACQLVLSGVRESLKLLREAHDAEVAPAHFAAVRAKVLARLDRERVSWRRAWLYGLASCAAAVLAAFAVWPGGHDSSSKTAISAPPQLVEHYVPAPPVASASTEPAKPVAAARRPHIRQSRAQASRNFGPGEPLVVKLVTDNPDVVIYWIADKIGE